MMRRELSVSVVTKRRLPSGAAATPWIVFSAGGTSLMVSTTDNVARSMTLTSLLLLVRGALVGVSYAQVAGGTILGRVTDPSGAGIADATVSVTNVATAVVTVVNTGSSSGAGYYTMPNLLPGTYQVAVVAPKFSEEVATGIRVSVGSEVTVNLQLRIGAVEARVEVEDAASQVETNSSTMSNVVGERAIRELPLNGRDWTQLAALQPGVATVRSQMGLSSERGQRGLGTAMTISGGRPQQ